MHKEYDTRNDLKGKVIHQELCKKYKFDHSNNWYMNNLECILENEAYKFLWYFEIKKKDHLTSVRRPDLLIVNKKKKKKKVKKREPAE